MRICVSSGSALGHRDIVAHSSSKALTKSISSPSHKRFTNTARWRTLPARCTLGRDTHALSEPAFASVLEVLAAHGVEVMVDQNGGYTPTPVISHAILTYNRGRSAGLACGIVITPSHNPPDDGGIKYNPPHGGPADTLVTKWIEDRANALMKVDLHGVAPLRHRGCVQTLCRKFPRKGPSAADSRISAGTPCQGTCGCQVSLRRANLGTPLCGAELTARRYCITFCMTFP